MTTKKLEEMSGEELLGQFHLLGAADLAPLRSELLRRLNLASLKAAGEGWIPCAERVVSAFGAFHKDEREYDGLRDAVNELRKLLPAKPAEGPAAKESKS